MKSRLYIFDDAKFVLIVLVVIGHLLDVCAMDHRMAKAAFVFIYSFHMPLFIFISGLFMNRDKLTAAKVINRVLLFIVLGFIAKIILAVVPALFSKPVSFSLLSDAGVPWFMFAMAAFCTLTYLLRSASQFAILGVSIVLGLFVGYDNTVGDFLYLSRIIVFFPFFWLGVMLKPEKVISLVNKPSLRAAGIVLVIAIAAFCVLHTYIAYGYRGLFTGRNCFESISGIDDCGWVNRLIAYIVSTMMCFGVLFTIPHSRIPLVSVAGQRTMQIYLLHFPLILLLRYSGCLALVGGDPHGWLLCFPVGVVISILLSIKWLEIPFKALSSAIAGKSL